MCKIFCQRINHQIKARKNNNATIIIFCGRRVGLLKYETCCSFFSKIFCMIPNSKIFGNLVPRLHHIFAHWLGSHLFRGGGGRSPEANVRVSSAQPRSARLRTKIKCYIRRVFSREQAESECDWVVMSSANQVAFFSARANKFTQ